jgi:hypothetical protein
MTCTAVTRRDTRSWLVLWFAISTVACSPELDRSGRVNSLPPGVPPTAVEYARYIGQFPLTGTPLSRKRKARCFWGLCGRIPVTIQPRGDPSTMKPEAPPAIAVAVAHMVSTKGNKRLEKYYGLLPGDSAEYDLWVYSDPDSHEARWAAVELIAGHATVTALPSTKFGYCSKDTPAQGYPAKADFAEYQHKECNYPLDVASSTPSHASLSVSGLVGSLITQLTQLLVQSARTAGGWIDCNNGCCT